MLGAAYQVFLVLLIVMFGMISIGLQEEHDKLKNHFAQLCGIGIVSLLATFWLM